MRLSEQKKSKLYEAMCRPIQDIRIRIRSGFLSVRDTDQELLDAELLIWRRICEALNLEKEGRE